MTKLRFIWLLVLILAGVYFALPVQAAETAAKSRAKLTADLVRYYDEIRQLEATGQVVISYEGLVITADYALIDQDQNVMLVKGHVKLTKDGDTFTGDRLLYYFASRQGWMAPADTHVASTEVNETITISAAEAYLKSEELLVKRSFLTGCNRDEPHYHFTAERVEYIPGKRIVLFRVWYWEGKIRLLYLPKINISLEGQENSFEMPEIGYNDIDGWYLRWGYNYHCNDHSYGRIYLDKITEKNGDGVGITHYLKPSPTSHWYQDYYYKDNSDLDYPKNDFRLGLGYKNWTRPNLNYETNLINRHSYNEFGDLLVENIYDFYLKGSSPWPYLKVYFRENDEDVYNYDPDNNNWVRSQDTFREMRFSNNWSFNRSSFFLNTSINWYLTEYLKQDDSSSQQFMYSGNATKNWNNSSLSLYYSNAQIAEGDYFSNNYLPELTYTISKLKLPLLNEVQSQFQYTKLEKIQVVDGEPVDQKTGIRWASDLKKFSSLWESNTSKWSLNLTSQFRYRFFDVENQQNEVLALTESLDARYQFNQYFSTALGVGYTEKEGPEDDFFNKGDNFLPGGFISNSWNWSSSVFYGNLSVTYSLYNYEPQPVYLNLAWTPAPQQKIGLNTQYDWEDGIGQTNLSINYNPNDNWRLELGLGYNPQDATWTQKEFQAFITQRLSSKLQLEAATVYDIFRDDFGVANFALVYDWHCRDLKFYYDHIEKEYWVMLSFKAFPGAKLMLSSDPDDYYNWYLN